VWCAYINNSWNHGSQVAHIFFAQILFLDGDGQSFPLVMGAQEVEEEFSYVPGEIGLIVEITVWLQVVLVNDCKTKQLYHVINRQHLNSNLKCFEMKCESCDSHE
jgi:hypothetical protein